MVAKNCFELILFYTIFFKPALKRFKSINTKYPTVHRANMKRRNAIIGMGTLALGSGVTLTSASFSNTADSGAAMDAVAVSNINVERGDDTDTDYDYESEIGTITNRGDLPAVEVSGSTQENNLQVDVSVANASEETFPYILEVSNTGTQAADVGIGFEINDTFVNDYEDIDDTDILEAYSFETNQSDSGGEDSSYEPVDGTEISPNTSSSSAGDTYEPASYVEVPAGENLALDLTVNLSGDIVGAINSEAGPAQSFDGAEVGSVNLIDTLVFGTDGS